MRQLRRRTAKSFTVVVAVALIMGPQALSPAQGQTTQSHTDDRNAATTTYFTALSEFANVAVFVGRGEGLGVSPYERDDRLLRAGFVTRPPTQDLDIVGPLYAARLPAFEQKPDFSRPEFRLQFLDLPENNLAGPPLLLQAHAQASNYSEDKMCWKWRTGQITLYDPTECFRSNSMRPIFCLRTNGYYSAEHGLSAQGSQKPDYIDPQVYAYRKGDIKMLQTNGRSDKMIGVRTYKHC